MENFEKMWNMAGFKSRWDILTNLGLHYKYRASVSKRDASARDGLKSPTFGELPQQMQRDMIHAAQALA